MDSSNKGEWITDGHYLYAPRGAVNVRALRWGLCYDNAPSEAVVLEHHVRIPREYEFNKLDFTPINISNYQFKGWDSSTEVKTTLRPHQLDPFKAMVNSGGGILNLGCGWGKTVLALNYAASVGKKTIVLLDKTNLISQWKEEIKLHLHVSDDKVGVVRGKVWDWEDKDIVLASLHTLTRHVNNLPKGFQNFGLAIFDECHHLAASTFRKVCSVFPGIRLGLSATPRREDGMEQVFINHLGRVFYSRTDQELIPSITFVKTHIQDISTDPEVLDRGGEINHRRLCSALGRIESRNSLAIEILDDLVRRGHKVLCLSHSVEYVRNFSEEVREKINVTVGAIDGGVKSEERNKIIKDSQVSIGTVDIASEALNVPELSALLILTPFGAKQHGNVLKQTLGRIQRVHKGKNNPECYFLYDSQVGMCRGLLLQCQRVLRKIGYPYDTTSEFKKRVG